MWILHGEKITDDMKWYAVQTAFVDGTLLDSKCCFSEDGKGMGGIQIASHSEEPVNYCKKEFFGRIEIHTDWFESMELAKAFCEGKITYVHHYNTYYKASIRSTLQKFSRREIVKVSEAEGIVPYRGIRKEHPLEYKPHWV